MKNDYVVVNGKVNVTDDRLGLLKYNCQDNVDDILITENAIEQIETELERTNDELITTQTDLITKFRKKDRVILYILEFIIPLIGSGIMILLNLGLLAILPLGAMSILVSLTKVIELSDKNDINNKINALNITIEELNKMLDCEKAKLKKLKKDRTNHNIVESVEIFELKNNHKLSKISKLIELYKMCGYYFKSLNKYQKDGTLREKFQEDYSDEELNIIENILTENNKRFVKEKR